MLWRLRLLCAAIAALLPISATATCAPPPASDGWAVAAPESVGIDADRLCALVPWVEGWKEGDIHAVLVARHAKLVFEQYFSGCPRCQPNADRLGDEVHPAEGAEDGRAGAGRAAAGEARGVSLGACSKKLLEIEQPFLSSRFE